MLIICCKIIVEIIEKERKEIIILLIFIKRCVIDGAPKELFIAKGERYKISLNNRFYLIKSLTELR